MSVPYKQSFVFLQLLEERGKVIDAVVDPEGAVEVLALRLERRPDGASDARGLVLQKTPPMPVATPSAALTRVHRVLVFCFGARPRRDPHLHRADPWQADVRSLRTPFSTSFLPERKHRIDCRNCMSLGG